MKNMKEDVSEGAIDFGQDDDNEPKRGKQKKKKLSSGGFQSMGLSFNVMKGILKRGYNVPTPIQRKTIPVLLTGKDLVAMARTGSGKTAAFLIPLLEKLAQQQQTVEIGISKTNSAFPRAIVLSPTRELALQTFKFAKELSRYINPTINIITILGSDSMDTQFELLHSKPHIVIATPGRFMHVLVEMELKLSGVETIIFDEADRLFEMGFGVQVNEIVHRLPPNRQTILLSATMPKLLVEFTKAGLTDPSLIRLDIETKLSENLQLTYLGSRSEDKMVHLLYLLRNVIDISSQQSIIFTATKYHVDYLHNILAALDIPNTYIYSSLDSSARKIALDKFRCHKVNILIVTDLASRGLDIPLLDNVINFHFPSKPKLFLHRVGRVARAGQSGTSYSIVSPDEMAYLVDLHLFLSKPLSLGDRLEENGNVVGRIPQEYLDVEMSSLKNLLDGRMKTELEQLTKVCRNGYTQYIKSRPPASVESNRRAKSILISNLPIHPLIFPDYQPDPLNTLIEQMHSFRPKSTIFEIGQKKNTSQPNEINEVMKEKRLRDQGIIAKFRQQKNDEIYTRELIDSSKSKTSKDENFISYLPSDYHTETGLAVGSNAEFNQQIQNSMMDLTGDDNEMLKSQRSGMKWDSRKKKFVHSSSIQGKKNNKNEAQGKRFKTESGVWISSSYKSNRYQMWKSKSKVDHNDDGSGDDEEGQSHNQSRLHSKGSNTFTKFKNGRLGVKDSKRSQDTPKWRKSEIKKPEVILKNRKVKEAKLKKNHSKKSKKHHRRQGGGSGGSRKRK